jgi:hypothetical protein
MTDRSFTQDRIDAAADWAGWPALPNQTRSEHLMPLLTETPHMSDSKNIEDIASELSDRVVARVQPHLTDLNQRFDAAMQRLDDAATEETEGWSGAQWAGLIGGVILAVVLSFFAGRATADDIIRGVPHALLPVATDIPCIVGDDAWRDEVIAAGDATPGTMLACVRVQ